MRRRIHSPLSNFFSSRASKPQQHQRQQRAIQAHGLLRSTALRADDKPQADHGPAPTLQPSVAMNYYYQPGYSHVPPAAMQQQNGPPRWTVPPAGPLHPLPHHHRDPSAQVQQQQQQHQQQRHQQQRHQQQRHQQQRHQQQQEQNPQHPPPTATTLPQGPLAQIPGLTLLHAISQPDPRSNAPPCPSPAVRVQPAKKGIKRKSARPGSKTNPPAATQNGTKLIASVVSEPSTSARNDPKEGRQVPSRESGGVPEPTPLYLARSFAPPATLPQPRRILVILDLNGTVLYRPTRRQPTTFIERPHARRFLAYCLEAFHLAVWSSARPDNVQHMLTQLLTRDQRERCVVTWARDRLGLSQDDYDSRVQCYKRLATVWNNEKVQASHPAADRGGCWDQSNTVLVDDSREKGRSEPHNILAVPEFSGLQNERADVLPQVHDYLNVLCHQQDISRYMRQSPFELDPSYQLFTSPPTGT